MNLSIIIPHLKGKTILNECIQSIYDTLDLIEYELIIVNNNCQDNSIQYIAKKFSQCKRSTSLAAHIRTELRLFHFALPY